MEFGKLDDISGVNWNLPSEDPRNDLRKFEAGSFKIHLGSPAWGNRHWIGKIYPLHTPNEQFLYHYSRNFDCIELNTTHYRIPDEVTVGQWLSQVPSNFLFCPKVNKEISHSQFGLLDKHLLATWINFLSQLKDNLGPSFIQFHDSFSYADKSQLFKFVELWPSAFPLSIELRHSSWFEDNKVLPALGDYLSKKNINLVMTDVAGVRKILHSSLTNSWAMIRLIGNNLDVSDEKRLKDWTEKFKLWKQKGLKDIYLFLHQPDDICTIEFAQMASEILTQEGFEGIPKFESVKPRDLFNFNS